MLLCLSEEKIRDRQMVKLLKLVSILISQFTVIVRGWNSRQLEKLSYFGSAWYIIVSVRRENQRKADGEVT